MCAAIDPKSSFEEKCRLHGGKVCSAFFESLTRDDIAEMYKQMRTARQVLEPIHEELLAVYREVHDLRAKLEASEILNRELLAMVAK